MKWHKLVLALIVNTKQTSHEAMYAQVVNGYVQF